MYLLNLSLAQFLMVFGSLSAFAVALYLLDRSRRRQVVSTLRFWTAAEQPAAAAKRRHIQQPWSLLLQLIAMALLLLAIAQVRFSSPEAAPRDHLIVLDTSAWMAARSGDRTLMDLAKERARAYLRAIPARDRVMLVRADALTTPATAFEPRHRTVEAAIAASEPGATALNLDQALAFANRLQQQGGRRPGEVAFIGTGRIAEREPGASAPPPLNLRVIPIAGGAANCGLRKIGLKRSTADPDVWQIYVATHNYGDTARQATLALQFGLPGPAPAHTLIASRRIVVPAAGDNEATFEYRTRTAGVLDIALSPHDAFAGDDQARLEVPAQPSLHVTVYSSEPGLLRPLLEANPRVSTVYRSPAQYRADDRGLVILDRFAPPQRPAADSLWIDPPAAGSPVPVRQRATSVPFAQWQAGQPIAAGLHMKDFHLAATSVFEPAPGDIVVGSAAAGPVVLARPASPKIAVLGFHPALSPMQYELALPLLFANLMRWTSPEIFRRWEIAGGSVGAVKMTLDDDTDAAAVKVAQEDGTPVPFTLRDRTLRFFTGAPGAVRVAAGDREYLYALTLPQLGDAKWEPPDTVRHGVPRPATAADASEMWPWLALAGGFCLLAEWLIYGRFGRPRGTGWTALLFRRRRTNGAEVRR
jgi:hypothetical protein